MDRRKRWPKGTWMQLTDSERLVRRMKKENFSLDRLARYAGCSKGMVSHLTAGRRKTCSPALAENIAEALDVDLDYLFMPQVSTQLAHNVKPTRIKVAA